MFFYLHHLKSVIANGVIDGESNFSHYQFQQIIFANNNNKHRPFANLLSLILLVTVNYSSGLVEVALKGAALLCALYMAASSYSVCTTAQIALTRLEFQEFIIN